MSEETKLIGITIPKTVYDKIVAQLKPLESVQDFIRKAVTEKLSQQDMAELQEQESGYNQSRGL